MLVSENLITMNRYCLFHNPLFRQISSLFTSYAKQSDIRILPGGQKSGCEDRDSMAVEKVFGLKKRSQNINHILRMIGRQSYEKRHK